MTSKKQKHEAALAKRESMLAEERRIGLEAQRRDREDRERKQRLADAERLRRMASKNTRIINSIFGSAEDRHDL